MLMVVCKSFESREVTWRAKKFWTSVVCTASQSSTSNSSKLSRVYRAIFQTRFKRWDRGVKVNLQPPYANSIPQCYDLFKGTKVFVKVQGIKG